MQVKDLSSQLSQPARELGLCSTVSPRVHSASRSCGERASLSVLDRLLKQQSRQSYISPVFIAMDYAELGDKDQAFAWLAKAFDEHSGWLLEINLEPTWDNLRTDRRFVDLIQRLGITR